MPMPLLPSVSPKLRYGLTALTAFVVVLYYLLGNLNFIASTIIPHQDIATFAAAADAVFTARVSPYNVAVLQNYRPANLYVIYPFLYPPSSLPFLAPLAGIDLQTVIILTRLLNCLLIAGLVVACSVVTAHLTRSLLAGMLIIPLLTEGSRGLWATLVYGQINVLLGIILGLCLWAMTRKKPIPAGILLGLAVTLKVYPAILMPWLALRRDWQTLGWCMGTLIALAAFTWVRLPHYLWQDWLTHVVAMGYGTQPQGLIPASNMGNLNLHGVLMRHLTDTPTIRLLAYASAAFVMLASFYTAYKRPIPLASQFCLILWASLLIAPLTWLSHLAYVLFIPVWFISLAWIERRWLWIILFSGVYGYALQLTQTDQPLPLWQQDMPCLGMFALWGLMLYQVWVPQKPLALRSA